MITFSDFAHMNGLIIRNMVIGKITRCPTEDHPRKMNGAFYFDHDFGWAMNWACHDEPQLWKSEKERAPHEQSAMNKRMEDSRRQQAKERAELARKAAAKAQALINAATLSTHNYYRSKQLSDVIGMVLPDGELILPMRDCKTDTLSGAQIIKWVDDKWEKKMLFGTRAKGAIFRLGNKSSTKLILCEGMATGHSISLAVKRLCMDASVIVCFSASNMIHVAPQIAGIKYVFADNDTSKTGEQSAINTGLPWVMSECIGDANDLHQQAGLLCLCQKINELMQK